MEFLTAPQDHKHSLVSAMVSRDMLGRLQEAMARSGRLSLSVCDPGGAVFTQATLDKDSLHAAVLAHRLFANEVIMKAQLQESYPAPVHRVPVGSGAQMLVAPLTVEGSLVGAVLAGPCWGRKPSREQVQELLSTVGSRKRATDRLAATALVASARVLAQMQDSMATMAALATQICEEQARHRRSVSTLATLNRIGHAVNSSLGLEPVLQEVLDSALALLGAECGSIMLRESEELRIFVARGLSREIVENTRVRMGDGVAGKVALEGQPRLLHRGVRESASRLKGRRSDMQSALCVPLKARDEIIGVLNVKGHVQGDDFTEEDLDVLSVMASHAAGAISNAQAYESANRRATEMSALFAIGTAINSELERNQVLQKVLDYAIDLLECRAGSILLVDHEIEELHIEVASGLPEEIINSVRLRLGEGIAGKVAQEGKARLLLKGVAETDSRSGGREHKSALCVPLMVREHVIGVINISDRMDNDNFTEDDLKLMTMLANEAAIAIENSKLHNDLHELFVSSITALANAIDARDPYTRGHSERVAVYAVRIGEHMGLTGKDLDFLRYASLLHDVGKINIKDEILNKPGRLTEDEFQIMKKHPEFGAAIMMPVKAFRKIIPFMYYHHERYCSGGGYPQGLQGDDIPLEARIISVADSYDAMTSHRPYRRALNIEQAVSELIKYAGSQFDPRVVDVFLSILEEDPDFARCGIEASVRAETEGWIRKSHDGVFITPGGHAVCPSPHPVPLRPQGIPSA